MEPVTCFLCGCSDRFEIIRDGTKLTELYCKRCDVFTPIMVASPTMKTETR